MQKPLLVSEERKRVPGFIKQLLIVLALLLIVTGGLIFWFLKKTGTPISIKPELDMPTPSITPKASSPSSSAAFWEPWPTLSPSPEASVSAPTLSPSPSVLPSGNYAAVVSGFMTAYKNKERQRLLEFLMTQPVTASEAAVQSRLLSDLFLSSDTDDIPQSYEVKKVELLYGQVVITVEEDLGGSKPARERVFIISADGKKVDKYQKPSSEDKYSGFFED